jgi:hypothetical protein
MGFELDIFRDEQLEADYIDWLVDEQSIDVRGHFEKLWEYYANPRMEMNGAGSREQKVIEAGRCYVQAQEYGMPARITGLIHNGQIGVFGARSARDIQRKEVVIENDIAWRINAAVDFLFGKPISFISKSPNGQKSTEIEAILKALFAANGAIGFFQDMAVLGSVYGFVDCFVRPGEEIIERISFSTPTHSQASGKTGAIEDVLKLA